jgi:hypothetical protein
MSYVVAGYVVVLSVLFLYGAQLVWRRGCLIRAAERVEALADTADDAPRPTSGAGEDPGALGR